MINLKVKLGVQNAKMKKPKRRIAKKRTNDKTAAGTGQALCTRQGTAIFFFERAAILD